MHFAHSLEGEDRGRWQPLAAHLNAVSQLTAARARKFGAERIGALAGLLHDLGKYSADFQAYIAGAGKSPDHATAGAREILRLAASGAADRLAALIGAYCIAGHHSGLPNWSGERALSGRLKKQLPSLDPLWQQELAADARDLFPAHFRTHDDKDRVAFQLAMFGRMVFSCLVDADFRDTEDFYCRAEGKTVDRDWRPLADVIGDLVGRFDAHTAGLEAEANDTELNRLRTDTLMRGARTRRMRRARTPQMISVFPFTTSLRSRAPAI